MTDKEFKRLSRSELIDIIYQLQLKQDELVAVNEKLSRELTDKRIRLNQAGSIAEAVVDMYHVMESAQSAADHYLEEIRLMREHAEKECGEMIRQAREKADAIIEQAQRDAKR